MTALLRASREEHAIDADRQPGDLLAAAQPVGASTLPAVLLRMRTALRRRRRVAALAVIVALGAVVALAHAVPEDHQMGDAVAMCFAIAASAAFALAARPRLGRLLAAPPRAGDAPAPTSSPAIRAWTAHRPRGDPAVLQVFRR